MASSSAGMTFGRSGTSSAESFIATVTPFALPEVQSKEDFMAMVKLGINADTSPERFKNTESTFEYSDQRGYPCVLYKASTEDTKAKTSFFSRSHLILQVQTLYCRLPNVEKMGFAASFSHRGATKVDDFDAQASDFIKDVQVPTGEPNNRMERQDSDKVPSPSVSAPGAHAER